ncbi:hypothetical protein KUTeg_000636 [Tegillarca granosa]|uniref:RING-type domain-containing protein n=1 Tax=Tegillarca granosa TaxID=220873 RepID=A0ABQ9G0V8_TEGGR|nr:hypothetical protein KUTeg_000636 [Tegillarca granosa]
MAYQQRHGKLKSGTSSRSDNSSTALAAVALQDHLVRSLGLGNLSGPKSFGPRNVGPGPAAKLKAKQKKEVHSVVDTGRNRFVKSRKDESKEKEYVLDPKPAPLTLVHPACLQAFERFTGKKTCPMCRKEQYQTRVIHEGSKQHRIKCATRIQSYWRGYVVRCWYKKLRESVPPKDPKLRQKFYEEKLSSITDRIIKSCDFDVNNFLYEIDQNLERSRDIFKTFDAAFHHIDDDEWEEIQLKAVKRGNLECPICLAQLGSKTYVDKSVFHMTQVDLEKPSNQKQGDSKGGKTKKDSSKTKRQTVLLSCSHVFHETCLNTFEDLTLQEGNPICPICRANYQKKIIPL